MKRRWFIFCALLLCTPIVQAEQPYFSAFTNVYPAVIGTKLESCLVCHNGRNPSTANPLDTARNAYGKSFEGQPQHCFSCDAANQSALRLIEALDSDGDGFSNGIEIRGVTFPGNKDDAPIKTDFTPPTVSISAPGDGSRYTNAQTVAITVMVTDNVAVANVNLFEDGIPVKNELNDPFTYNWALTKVDNGVHQWWAVAYDTSQNAATSGVVNVNVNIDIIPPKVTLLAPNTGARYTNAQTVTISAAADDNIGVAQVDFYEDGALKGTRLSSPYDYSWSITATDNGSHTWWAIVSDTSQNSNRSSPITLKVDIDIKPPTVRINSPTNNSSFTSAQSVTIEAAAEDNVGVAKVEFLKNDVLQGTLALAPFDFTWPITPDDNGTYVWTVRAYDLSGNTTVSLGVTNIVNIGLAPPSVSITDPKDGTTYTNAQTVRIQAAAFADVAIGRVEFYEDDKLMGTASKTPYAFSWPITSEDNGQHRWTVIAFDTSQNASPPASVTIGVNITPPTVSIDNPSAGTRFTTAQPVTIEASVKPVGDLAIKRVEFYANGSLKGTQVSSPYNIGWRVTAEDNGPNVLTAKAFDSAGNIGVSAPVTIFVDIRTISSTNHPVLLGWSDTGLHETDGTDPSTNSVYSLSPAFSTLRAQLILDGKLVTNAADIIVTYEARADATGSINTTSSGKGTVSPYAQALLGHTLPDDQGIAGFAMPGPTNALQQMAFNSTQNWFYAEGIPLTPLDDDLLHTNFFPMMRLKAWDSHGALLTNTDVVLPVSDQMDCRLCHASGSQLAARPASGWTWDCDPDPVKDYKMNILRYHDEARGGADSYKEVLIKVGYNPAGLVATVTENGQTVLCIRCHASNAVAGSGEAEMRPLTRLIHTKHAKVLDPKQQLPLDDLPTSEACLRCHAGPEMHFLRGAHRNQVTADGALAISCQSCHGTLQEVGDRARRGWLDQPSCQNCHTGTARNNSGQLTYTNVFEPSRQLRLAADPTFSTGTNAASGGQILYREASEHGGLKCAACHGPVHAEAPGLQPNENVQNEQWQGHVGVIVECSACHPSVPTVINGGPHGMHPVGQSWDKMHEEISNSETAQCQSCHGTDYRGTRLGLMQSDQSYNLGEDRGQQLFWRGFQIGCYNCHAGPSGREQGDTPNHPAEVGVNRTLSTTTDVPLAIPLQASDPDGDQFLLRIVSQPTNGIVSLNPNGTATYFPIGAGSDSFTYAAWDGLTDSNLGTNLLNVTPGACALTVSAAAPTWAMPGSSVSFRGGASLDRCVALYVWEWDFGDKTPHSADANPCHIYTAAGEFPWTLKVTAKGRTQTVTGLIRIDSEPGSSLRLTITQVAGVVSISWPVDRLGGTVLEVTSDPANPAAWQVVDRPIVTGPDTLSFQAPLRPDPQFFRLRRLP